MEPLASASAPGRCESGTAGRPHHSPPIITIFLLVSSPMNDLTKLKATGNSLGAGTHKLP